MDLLIIILVVFLVLSAGGGTWSRTRWGWAGYSPAGVLLFVLLILLIPRLA